MAEGSIMPRLDSAHVRSVIRRVAIVTLAVLVLASVATYLFLRGKTWTFSFTQQQIEEQLATRFPVRKPHLLVASVLYENPRVRLTEGSSEIGVGVDARVLGTVNDKKLSGSADLVTRIAYDPGNGTFVLHDAQLVQLDVAGVKRELVERVMDVANELAAEKVSGIPIYELRPTEVKAAFARLVLESVTVRDGVLYVEVGL